MAARAYDYETGLLDIDGNASSSDLYEKIVQARALGVVTDGVPQFAGSSTGDPGLSGVLAELAGDWSVVKSRLGFNNPDNYRTAFSLREENYRLIPGAEADGAWRDILSAGLSDNILNDPDVRRYVMQSGDEEAFAVPGIVIEFSTEIRPGYNFFGKPLAAGDHSFSPTSFATKIRSSGVAFKGYIGMDDPTSIGGTLAGIGAQSPSDPNLTFTSPDGLSATPYIYLIPAGSDMMRSPPLGDTDTIRTWSVQDQAVPLPFNIANSDYSTQPAWVSAASLSEPPFMLRKHQAFRAVPENNPQFFINFNNEVDINDLSFTELTFNVDDVPASSSFITLRFEMITGAVEEADVSVAIDNILVTGPSLPVEGEWEGYVVDNNGWVDTGAHLGFINVNFEPWFYSLKLDRFFFVADSSLISASAVGGTWLYMTK